MPQRGKVVFWGMLTVLASLGAFLAVATVLGWRPGQVVARTLLRSGPPIRIGLLHSQSGPLAISELSLLDAEILAVEEINASGGIAGRLVTYSKPDCRSDPAAFATAARVVIEQDQAVALFGGWTSNCRKAMIPVVEERAKLLFFPGNFEGIERSRRVVYSGGAANQSVLPAIRWAFDSLKARRFYVIGLEEVWSRTCAEIAKDALKAAGAELIGEEYLPPTRIATAATVEAIRRANPDVVLNFYFGEANKAFYSALHSAKITPEAMPTIAFGFSEDEARQFVLGDVVGHYAAWNYFQSLNRLENQAFIRRFRARFGENRTVGDAMVAAYNGILMWAQTAREVGSPDALAVIDNLDSQSMDAPDGIVTIDPDSRAFWRPFHVGRMRPEGQFEIVFSIDRPIRPVTYLGTRSADQWRALQTNLHERWRGQWSLGQAPDPGSRSTAGALSLAR